jgi:large subunit ribosomal protein L17
MRHLNAGRKLSADTQHRLAMRRNMARNLFLSGRVVTTPAKAKSSRPFIEKLVTRAKRAHGLKSGDRGAFIHQLRVLQRDVQERKVLHLLVDRIAPLFADRPGGYTRIVHEARRQIGDRSKLVILEFVERPKAEEAPEPAAEEATPGKGKRGKGEPKTQPEGKARKGQAGEPAAKPAKAKKAAAPA